MLDTTTDKGRIIDATLKLAAERPWAEIALIDIAEAARVNLVDLKQHFTTKGEILAAFAHAIDDDMLKRTPARTPGQAPRDALFEVVMSRFDALAPYRASMRSIARAGSLDLALLRAFVASQHWMLQAAGVSTDGLGGGARLAGLASVYGSVMQTWLDDDDPGLARTMAALDRRLRSGERTLRMVDGAIGLAERVCSAVSPFGRRRTASADAPPPPPTAAPSSGTTGGIA